MLENLLEEEGLAGLSGSRDQKCGRVTESHHDSDRLSDMKLQSDEVAESQRVYIVLIT